MYSIYVCICQRLHHREVALLGGDNQRGHPVGGGLDNGDHRFHQHLYHRKVAQLEELDDDEQRDDSVRRGLVDGGLSISQQLML